MSLQQDEHRHDENNAVRPVAVVPRKRPKKKWESVEGGEDNHNNNVLHHLPDDDDEVIHKEEEDEDDDRQSRPSTGPDAHTSSTTHHPTEKDDYDFTVGTCRSIRDFVKVGRLGRGTYGIVYQARERTKSSKPRGRSHRGVRTTTQDVGTTVALKRCIPHHEATDGFPITALREIAALRHCAGHPNIVQLHDVAVSRSGVFWVLDDGGFDLAHLVDAHYGRHRCSPFSVAAVKTLVLDLLQAIRHVHNLFIIHRDVKLGNLLYGSDGKLRLADFGLARTYDPHASLTLQVASLWYRPPELLLGAVSYGPSIDLWACGCVLGELLVGRPLFAGTNDSEQIQLILNHLGPWPASDPQLQYPRRHLCPPPPSTALLRKRLLDVVCPGNDDKNSLSLSGWRLLIGLLHYNPSQRWTSDQALASPFFGNGRDAAESPVPDPPAPLAYAEMPRFPPPGK